MESDNKNAPGYKGLVAKIIMIVISLIGAVFLNKELKKHNLRLPTIGEYLVFAFIFSIGAWIVLFVILVVVKVVGWIF